MLVLLARPGSQGDLLHLRGSVVVEQMVERCTIEQVGKKRKALSRASSLRGKRPTSCEMLLPIALVKGHVSAQSNRVPCKTHSHHRASSRSVNTLPDMWRLLKTAGRWNRGVGSRGPIPHDEVRGRESSASDLVSFARKISSSLGEYWWN